MGYGKTIKEITMLVGVSVVLALVVNYFSPRGIDLVGQWNTANGIISANAAGDETYRFAEIDQVADAAGISYDGNILFVDARTTQNYQSGHIPGAISLPVGQFDEQIEWFLKRYPPNQPIVTYCSDRTCEGSHHLAQLLIDIGISEVRVFVDGYAGWEAAGYPIE